MRNIKINVGVGGTIEVDASRRFVDDWHRAKRGKSSLVRHLTFENWDTLVRGLTAKRLDILRHVHRHTTRSIRSLAKALARDCSNGHVGIQALANVGLLEVSKAGVRVEYDSIETKIAS